MCYHLLNTKIQSLGTTPQYNFKNMKKILFLIVVIIISGNISAQKLDWQERRKAADEVDEVIENYINTCELSPLGKSAYADEQVEDFKNMFTDDAKITDGVSSQAAEDGGREVVEQTPDEYTQALMARYPKGMTIKLSKLQADYTELDQQKVRVAMERQFRAKDESGRYVLDTADVMLELTIDRDLEFAKIKRLNTEPPPPPRVDPESIATAPIAKKDERMSINLKRGEQKKSINLKKNIKNPAGGALAYKVTIPPKRGKVIISSSGIATYTPQNPKTKIDNDQFEYEVCNENGLCDKARVMIDIEIETIPPNNKRGFYINPNIAFGVTSNNSNILWGYETVRSPLSADISGNSGANLSLGIEVDYYFSNNLGIGAGLQYQSISGGFDVNDFDVKYASNIHNAPEIDRNYERIITMNGVTENFTMTNIGIPLLLKFRTHPENKIGIFAHAGIQYNLISSSTSSLNSGAMANYEGIRYTTESDGFPEEGYNSATGEIDNKFTWFQTAESYAAHGTAAQVEAHFNELYEDAHNLGINIPLDDSDNSANLDPHLNILGRIGLVYNMSQNIALQVGAQYTSGTLRADSNYQISDSIVGEGDNKRGEYTTLLKGGPGYAAFGLNAGISLRLSGKKSNQ